MYFFISIKSKNKQYLSKKHLKNYVIKSFNNINKSYNYYHEFYNVIIIFFLHNKIFKK